jgi:hypothetical protein
MARSLGNAHNGIEADGLEASTFIYVYSGVAANGETPLPNGNDGVFLHGRNGTHTIQYCVLSGNGGAGLQAAGSLDYLAVLAVE